MFMKKLKAFALLFAFLASSHPSGAVTFKEFTVATSIAFVSPGPDGAIWYTHNTGPNGGIGRITVAGESESILVPPYPSQPWGLAQGPSGDLWVTDANEGRLWRFAQDGTWQEIAIPWPSYSITLGPDGKMWFVTPGQVGRLEPNGAVTLFDVEGQNTFLGTITKGPDENLWFSVRRGDSIGRITPSGKVTLFPVREGSWPFSVTTGPDNHIWFTEVEGNRIGRLSTSGQLSEFDLPHPGSRPRQITAGPDGNLWFTDYGGRLWRITPEGQISGFDIPNRELSPSGLTFGPDGNLWIGYSSGWHILRMTLGGTPITGPCNPSDTILCIDDAPGDRRFQVEIEYETEQAGGMSGHGRAVPLSSLGVARGGLFWFFGADNPEIIVKILNGCASNQKYWVFISGGTNVGMIITVSDTVTGEVHTYYNRDLTPFAPVQDTRALSCGE
jgi:virginiamycin B lyase